MSNSESWFCRIDGEAFGPLSLTQILHYIILQRVGEDDEVSNDGTNWQPLKQAKMLDPKAVMGLKGVLSEQDLAYLEASQAWRDEHLSVATEDDESDDQFSRLRRRGVSKRNPVIGYVVIIALIAVVVAASLMVPRSDIEIVPDCTTAPAPEINWSNCRFEKAIFSNRDLQAATLRNAFMAGSNLQASNLSNADIAYANLSLTNLKGTRFDGADLRGVNLRRADLRRASLVGADLSFADMTGANLTGANLEGTVLSNTIWTDGKICKQGSVGRCIRNF